MEVRLEVQSAPPPPSESLLEGQGTSVIQQKQRRFRALFYSLVVLLGGPAILGAWMYKQKTRLELEGSRVPENVRSVGVMPQEELRKRGLLPEQTEERVQAIAAQAVASPGEVTAKDRDHAAVAVLRELLAQVPEPELRRSLLEMHATHYHSPQVLHAVVSLLDDLSLSSPSPSSHLPRAFTRLFFQDEEVRMDPVGHLSFPVLGDLYLFLARACERAQEEADAYAFALEGEKLYEKQCAWSKNRQEQPGELVQLQERIEECRKIAERLEGFKGQLSTDATELLEQGISVAQSLEKSLNDQPELAVSRVP
jgi:hypothetical protein